jgi:hypothetical protein
VKTSRLKTGTGLAINRKKHVKPLTQSDNTHENTAANGQVSIHRKLKRISQLDQQDSLTANPEENGNMITKVIIRPNPFETFIALEITCVQSKNIIIRLTDMQERIVKMFSWFIVKGDNVTNFSEIGTLTPGAYRLDVMDLEGELIFSTEVVKK